MSTLMDHERRVLDAIDQDALLESVCALVSIPSLGGFETPAQEWVADLLLRIGLEVDVWELDFSALSEHPGYSTEIDRDHGLGVVGRVGEEAGGRGLILNGHVDVVPAGHEDRWSGPPFVPRVSDGRIYGRGAVDMKAGLCSAIFAAKAIRDAQVTLAGPLFIESVIGEEDGGVGTLGAIVRGYRAQGAIVMEPTGLEIATTGAGCHNFRIHVPGQAAHGALRSEGVSAIRNAWPIFEALEDLEGERNAAGDPAVPGDLPFPICVGKMSGGEWASSVAEEVVMEGRYGVRPGEDPSLARAALESVVARAAEGDPWLCDHPPRVEWWGGRFESARVDPDCAVAATLREAHWAVTGVEARLTGVPYGSDMGLMVNHGDTPCVLYGPGDVRRAHRPDEFVPIEEVVSATRALALAAMRFCGTRS
jgi:acetylornithine deacetylase